MGFEKKCGSNGGTNGTEIASKGVLCSSSFWSSSAEVLFQKGDKRRKEKTPFAMNRLFPRPHTNSHEDDKRKEEEPLSPHPSQGWASGKLSRQRDESPKKKKEAHH
ncbi:hypothetical protein QOT17_017566 [Balamuthia mandrillaris]